MDFKSKIAWQTYNFPLPNTATVYIWDRETKITDLRYDWRLCVQYSEDRNDDDDEEEEDVE